ncbi:MAG: D-Ala-D-Ala carboxypeptidase family metallohydrolase [Cyanobacteria bacterium P01_H01_bin.121]
MTRLTAEQRNYLYLIEAERTGIHKPILAALYDTHQAPRLEDGETGLGISPIHRVELNQVLTLVGQVQFGANTIRDFTDMLIRQGWNAYEIWDNAEGRYTDGYLEVLSQGYAPSAPDSFAAQLEVCDFGRLLTAYLTDLQIDFSGAQLAQNLSYLDPALLALLDRLPQFYRSLSFQQQALLEAVRIWRRLPTPQAAIQSLSITEPEQLDQALLSFCQRISPNYSGYPHQREALLRLSQLWRQLDSREEAIASLKANTLPQSQLQTLDPALIAFVQRVSAYYRGRGQQRNALTEGFRLWRQLDSRTTTLTELGIPSTLFTDPDPDPQFIQQAALQLDQELLRFTQRIPTAYQGTDVQRQALVRMVQLWRGLETQTQTIANLIEDVRRMETARRDSADASPAPVAAPIPRRPTQWAPHNLIMHTAIVESGSFTWAEATRGGARLPPDQATVNAIINIAELAQQARDRIGRPFIITSWYRPPDVNRRVGGASQSRHIVGDAIDFYVDGLTGDQVYWSLDPWWPGGLGRYTSYPYLCHIDARSYRARWQH